MANTQISLEMFKEMDIDMKKVLREKLISKWIIGSEGGICIWHKNRTGIFMEYKSTIDIAKLYEDENVVFIMASDAIDDMVEYILSDESYNSALTIYNSDDPFYDYMVIYERDEAGELDN